MRAVYYECQGPADGVLCVADLSIPQPGPREVRVRVHVSGLSPTDLKARTGFSSTIPFPRIIPHQDGAGVIDAVGDAAEDSRIGQRVGIYEAQFGTAAILLAKWAGRGRGHSHESRASRRCLRSGSRSGFRPRQRRCRCSDQCTHGQRRHGCVLRFVYIYSVPVAVKVQAARDINACLASGQYIPHIGMNVPLEKIAHAHLALESGSVMGKVLVAL